MEDAAMHGTGFWRMHGARMLFGTLRDHIKTLAEKYDATCRENGRNFTHESASTMCW
jgi:hypothetical protein